MNYKKSKNLIERERKKMQKEQNCSNAKNENVHPLPESTFKHLQKVIIDPRKVSTIYKVTFVQ